MCRRLAGVAWLGRAMPHGGGRFRLGREPREGVWEEASAVQGSPHHRHPSVTQDAEHVEGNASPIKNHTPSWICIPTLCFIPHIKVPGLPSLSDGVQMEKMSYHRFLSHLIMGVECRNCQAWEQIPLCPPAPKAAHPWVPEGKCKGQPRSQQMVTEHQGPAHLCQLVRTSGRQPGEMFHFPQLSWERRDGVWCCVIMPRTCGLWGSDSAPQGGAGPTLIRPGLTPRKKQGKGLCTRGSSWHLFLLETVTFV